MGKKHSGDFFKRPFWGKYVKHKKEFSKNYSGCGKGKNKKAKELVLKELERRNSGYMINFGGLIKDLHKGMLESMLVGMIIRRKKK
jgi:hypothetical protein